MTTFLLVRHAEHTLQHQVMAGRMEKAPLSEQGRLQSKRLAARLATTPLTAIYSSPLERAQQTAECIAQPHDLPFGTSEALTEFDFGDWTGKTLEELKNDPRWQPFNVFRSGIRAPGGERLLDVQTRIVDYMQRLQEEAPEGYVALVTHGDVIRSAVMYWLGMPLDLLLRLEISLASITTVVLQPYGPQVLCVNEARHVSE